MAWSLLRLGGPAQPAPRSPAAAAPAAAVRQRSPGCAATSAYSRLGSSFVLVDGRWLGEAGDDLRDERPRGESHRGRPQADVQKPRHVKRR